MKYTAIVETVKPDFVEPVTETVDPVMVKTEILKVETAKMETVESE